MKGRREGERRKEKIREMKGNNVVVEGQDMVRGS